MSSSLTPRLLALTSPARWANTEWVARSRSFSDLATPLVDNVTKVYIEDTLIPVPLQAYTTTCKLDTTNRDPRQRIKGICRAVRAPKYAVNGGRNRAKALVRSSTCNLSCFHSSLFWWTISYFSVGFSFNLTWNPVNLVNDVRMFLSKKHVKYIVEYIINHERKTDAKLKVAGSDSTQTVKSECIFPHKSTPEDPKFCSQINLKVNLSHWPSNFIFLHQWGYAGN